MAFDIKAKVEEIVNKVKGDPNLASEFQKDPVKAVEKVTGIDIPDDQVEPVITAVKAKLSADQFSDMAGKLGGLFKK